ncbi:MAG: serine hydrolase domain-containing protein [Promethearchaeota archaeon]|jgi:CubicO group peptidase (beta-lactamase class C family)
MKKKIEKLIICIISLGFITSFSLASLLIRGINESFDNTPFSDSNLSTQDIMWPGNSSEWTEVAPETQGLDSDKISEMFELIEDRSYNIHSVIIVRNGYLLTEEYLLDSQLTHTKSYYGGSTIHMQQSTTKSLMSILIGVALQEGFLDNLNQTLYEFFADIWEPNFTNSTLKKNITIEQLLTMNSGLVGDDDPSYPPDAKTLGSIDILNWALDLVPLGFTPGEEGEYSYSNDGTNLLSGIITNVTGNSTVEFAKKYLFTPLGIAENEYDWWHDTKNMYSGGYGFSCSPKVQAKLGMLCLNDGAWNGTQIVDSNFMKNATKTKISWGSWGGYGYLFYTMRTPYQPFNGYNTYGAGGQCIYILPEYNITVGFAGAQDMDHVHLLVDYIVQLAADNAPNWDQMPEDQLIREGDSFFYDVNATDTSGVEYSINNTASFTISPEGIITNSSSLSLGVYPLEISAYNSFNNSITATIQIRVISISSNAIPGFDFNMLILMILFTSAVFLFRMRKKSYN